MTELRRLGQSNLYLSPLGLGAWQFGNAKGIWTQVDEELVNGILAYGFNNGINWVDTAEIYGRGTSENFLGQGIESLLRRRQIKDKPYVATKWFPLLRRASTIEPTINQQLQRLKMTAIDLYQIHHPTSVSSLEKQIETLADLLHQRKIKNIGVSNFTANQMIKADQLLQKHGLRLVSNQVKYNLLDRHIERTGVLEAAKERGIALIAYSPLQQGLLTGRFHDDPELRTRVGLQRRLQSRISRQTIERTQPLIDGLGRIGRTYDKTPAQVALNWLIHANGKTVFAIPGASKLSQIQSNVQAQNFRLSQSDLESLDALSQEVTRRT